MRQLKEVWLIILKTSKEIELQAEACKIVADILSAIRETAKSGVTTKELDSMAEGLTGKYGATPAFKGVKARGPYIPFPAVICASVNDEVIHGIPSDKPLEDGDILSVDFGVKYKGFYGDSAVTIPIGDVAEETRELLEVTEESLARAIKKSIAGNRLSDISHAVQSYVESKGYSVVRAFVGHGIGRSLHEEPQIPNFGAPGRGVRLKVGMVIAIEPMVNEGTHIVDVLDDGWTAVTQDGKMSAHFEHTVAITKNGPIVLTKV